MFGIRIDRVVAIETSRDWLLVVTRLYPAFASSEACVRWLLK